MLTKLTISNFKCFGEVEIELGSPVVFIGPNNSGKTSAMQALALWNVGLMRWNEKRSGNSTPKKRPGVAINRRDLVAIPIPEANLLWRDLHVRDVRIVDGRQRTSNVRIEIIVEGLTRTDTGNAALSSTTRMISHYNAGRYAFRILEHRTGCPYPTRPEARELPSCLQCRVWPTPDPTNAPSSRP